MHKCILLGLVLGFSLSGSAVETANDGATADAAASQQAVVACTNQKEEKKLDEVAPFTINKVTPSDPDFQKMFSIKSDGNMDALDIAVTRQLRGCDGQPDFVIGREKIPSSRWCRETNQQIKNLLADYRKNTKNPNFDEFSKSLQGKFDWYKMDCPDKNPERKSNQSGGVLFTAYDAPKIKCSRNKVGKFTIPIYGIDPPAGKKLTDYTRSDLSDPDIDKPKPKVIAYTDDAFGLYVLGIEGSGTCDIDGKPNHIDYSASNGQPNTLLNKVLDCMGVIRQGCSAAVPAADCKDRRRMNIPEMRAFFNADKDMLKRALDLVPSYPFFELVARGPLGSAKAMSDSGKVEKIELSNGHSLAIPPEIPLGVVTLFQSWKPGVNEMGATRNFSTIAIGQDRGGAIKGCRVDWFAGTDRNASTASGTMAKEKGTLFIAIARSP